MRLKAEVGMTAQDLKVQLVALESRWRSAKWVVYSFEELGYLIFIALTATLMMSSGVLLLIYTAVWVLISWGINLNMRFISRRDLAQVKAKLAKLQEVPDGGTK